MTKPSRDLQQDVAGWSSPDDDDDGGGATAEMTAEEIAEAMAEAAKASPAGVVRSRRQRSYRCGWCSVAIGQKRVGRPRKYCTQSCRQHAYLQRKTNRAATWVDHQERRYQYLHRRLQWLTEEWGHELHHPNLDPATHLQLLWDDVWTVSNRPARDVLGNDFYLFPPRHARPAHRDIGDSPDIRDRPRSPFPHVATFPFATAWLAAFAERPPPPGMSYPPGATPRPTR